MNKKIGWIGTGVMGLSMCDRLINQGYSVNIYNRTKSKAQNLIDKGATFLNSPAEIAKNSDIVFTIVGFVNDVEEVYFGENGLFSEGRKGQIFCDMTTTSPTLSKKIFEKGKTLGISTLDAPVSGGDIGAKNGTLSIMVGGEKNTFDSMIEYFKILGKSYILEGPAGSGSHTKMANQITIAGTMGGVCEALLYSQKNGLDLNLLIDTIKSGAAGCWTLDNLAPRIIKNNYAPGFYIDHFVKDMKIALQECKNLNLHLPTLELIEKLYEKLQANGKGNLGTQALILALNEINNS
ncbi:MAG: NAD(P)-dependent oxidoreductase [Spirochaetia bacterium]|nr:NAD(P)-dependent oxidoreductase [Spirochaetia bacterium]